MSETDLLFLSLIDKCTRSSIVKAHALLMSIDNSVLTTACHELLYRAVHVHTTSTTVEKEYALQLANQIIGVLETRGIDARILSAKLMDIIR